MLNVDSLSKGVVIDHIEAGRCMEIYHYLGLGKLDCSVAVIQNAKSNRMGKKDIIKIDENIDINLDVLGFIDHNITINIIDGGKIIEKKVLSLPSKMMNIIKCTNPRCITSIEQEIEHMFTLSDKKSCRYRCVYCDHEYDRNKDLAI